jgi:hypothetical protein
LLFGFATDSSTWLGMIEVLLFVIRSFLRHSSFEATPIPDA